jgi:eukaryotic-like serine/threonine-protein kinase
MMQPSPASPNNLRFGLFEVDLTTGELRKRGRKVMLQEQPFKLLALLLRRPGELVTREELQQALWPGDTFVEFDESLNKAIQKLRQALGDSPDNPHFIETIPRRGYRFITPVERVEPDGQAEEPHPPDADQGALSPTTARRLHRERTLWIAALAAATAIILALWIQWPSQPPARLRKYTLAPQRGFDNPVISPDGRQIAYTAAGSVNQTDQPAGAASATRLWIQDLNREEPREIAGTDGAHALPFWSPDSAFVGIAIKNQLWKVPIQGSGPSLICEISGALLGGTWSLDGRTIVFSVHHQGIYEVPASGGVPKMLIPLDHSAAGDHFDTPYLLPTRGGDRSLLYAAQRIGAIHDIVLRSLRSGKRTVLAQDSVDPSYSATGHILYKQTAGVFGVIRALPFSLATMSATGEAFTVALNGHQPSVARDGTLVYWAEGSWPRIQLAWHDRSGHKIAAAGLPEPIETMSLSPDGRSVAFNLIRDGNEDKKGIWILDAIRGTNTRLTFSPQADIYPVWSPTGKQIAFASNRLGRADIYTAAIGGSGDVSVLVAGLLHKQPNDWSPDGRILVYEMEDPKTGRDLWYLKAKQGGGYESALFLRTPAYEGTARFSPDGQFLAYVSTESGRPEVYVRHFPDGSEMRRISVGGGWLPAWRKDGKELFYLEGETLVSVAVATRPVFSIGETRRLFKSPGLTGVTLSASFYADPMYGVSADGQRFLFPEIVGQAGKSVIHVVENWFEEFRNRTAGTR